MRRTGIRAGQRLARLAVTVLVGVAVLAGCSAEGQQASTELPPASSTSAKPTPELPPLGPADFPVPDEARLQDEAGARAFFSYYVELLNRQQAVPDGQPLRELGPDCRQCLVIAQRLDEAAAAGLRIQGGAVSVISGPAVGLAGDRANFSFIARAEAATVVRRNGDAVPEEEQPAQDRLPSALEATWSEEKQSWLATGLSFG